MTEAATKNFERTDCKSDASTACSLAAELMTCKSSNDIFRQRNDSTSNALSFLPQAEVCYAPHQEKRGPVEVTIDEYGEMFEVKDNHGNTYTKTADGKWNQHFESGDYKTDSVVENLKVDCDGNLSYDYNDDARNVHVKHEHNADGSWRTTNEFGTFCYDNKGRLTEAPSGEGQSRKFHYDKDGQLDEIDGNLGHWDRVVSDGQTSWVNKDTGAVWEGEFKLTLDLLEYSGRNGANWTFTPWGTDINNNERK